MQPSAASQIMELFLIFGSALISLLFVWLILSGKSHNEAFKCKPLNHNITIFVAIEHYKLLNIQKVKLS